MSNESNLSRLNSDFSNRELSSSEFLEKNNFEISCEKKLDHIAQETFSGEHDLDVHVEADLKGIFQMKTPEGIVDVLYAKGMSDRDLLWWINNS